MYLFHLTSMPDTRRNSYREYCNGRKQTIKTFLIDFLKNYPQGVCCRDIAQISGIYVQSLTNPLKELVDDGTLEIKGISRHDLTRRLVHLYGLSKPEKS